MQLLKAEQNGSGVKTCIAEGQSLFGLHQHVELAAYTVVERYYGVIFGLCYKFLSRQKTLFSFRFTSF
jgi:hypothetical protein